MPISFSLIPDHIKISITEKLDLLDYTKFYGSSRESFDIAKGVKKRFPFFKILFTIRDITEGVVFKKDDDYEHKNEGVIPQHAFIDCPIYLKSVVLNIPILSSEMAQGLIQMFSVVTHAIRQFMIDQVTCSHVEFQFLLETIKLQHLWFHFTPISPEYLLVPAVENIAYLSARSFVSDEVLMVLSRNRRILTLAETNISSVGINTLLKNLSREREGKKVKIVIRTRKRLLKEVVFNGMSHSPRESGNPQEEVYDSEVNGRTFVVKFEGNRCVNIYKHEPDAFITEVTQAIAD